MSFSDIVKNNLKSQYVQADGLADNFYKPLLKEATLYQRVSGYFSTAGIDLYAEGLDDLAKNNGTAQFIVSKDISKDDYVKLKKGYELRDEIESLTLAERNDKLSSKAQEQLGNLAFLIANGRANVKIALTTEGLFHDKFGIISSEEESVFFNGSVNETRNGIGINYESISVDTSWDISNNVKVRIDANKERFQRLWNNEEEGILVREISNQTYEEIAKYQSLANIVEVEPKIDTISDDILENAIEFKFLDNTVVRIDNSEIKLTEIDRKLKKGKDLSKYFEEDNATIKLETPYIDIQSIIKITRERATKKNVSVIVSDAVQEYLVKSQYSIEQYKILGELYKKAVENFPIDKQNNYETFANVVQSEVERPLRDLHLRAAYFQYEMARAANFSVPGSGKTAMVLGVFAFLNSSKSSVNERIERILVISPINAFDSWKREFKAVFGDKKELTVFGSQDEGSFQDKLKTDWGVSNLVLVNYESLIKNGDQLEKLIDDRTMIVFDEVHRIKNPDGKRAEVALRIAKKPKFKYVLTGTPIPNTYRDIYNFLHILYGNEYNAYFGWNPNELLKPKIRQIEEINEKIHPFFWRTNKDDLNVPKADEDKLLIVKASLEQEQLAEEIYFNESSSLAKLIRLIQASTNPSLINQAINYNELIPFDENGESKVSGITEKEFKEYLKDDVLSDNKINNPKYSTFNETISPKFQSGIELVTKLVRENKKVMVWGIFVDTLNKITDTLSKQGIKVNLVYGRTDKQERTKLIDEFRDGDVQVMVSNPQTLGESVSLHQSVHDAVYFEYDFNLTFMLQSRDRIHRLGLKDKQYTRYYYLQTASEDAYSDKPGFIDEKIYARLKTKERIMYDAVDDDTVGIEYSDDEIAEAIEIIELERNRINSKKI